MHTFHEYGRNKEDLFSLSLKMFSVSISLIENSFLYLYKIHHLHAAHKKDAMEKNKNYYAKKTTHTYKYIYTLKVNADNTPRSEACRLFS